MKSSVKLKNSLIFRENPFELNAMHQIVHAYIDAIALQSAAFVVVVVVAEFVLLCIAMNGCFMCLHNSTSGTKRKRSVSSE